MVTATLKVPGLTRPVDEMKWKPVDEPHWEHLSNEVEEPLAALHAWYHATQQRIEAESTDSGSKQHHLNDAVAVFGAILLSTIWRKTLHTDGSAGSRRRHPKAPPGGTTIASPQ